MKLKDFQLLETDVPKGVQAILNFAKYELSIIQNESSYGNKQGLYEIAVFEGGSQIELPGITAPGDTVKGYLTESDIDAIISKMYFLTGNTPRQI
jgi:hypothetical protein